MALVKAENVTEPFAGFVNLPVLRQLGLMIGLAASVAVGVAVVMWAMEPSFRLLQSEVPQRDMQQIAQSLQQDDIQFKFDEVSGALYVEGSRLREARMKLASAGLTGAAGEGFEILDQQDGFGSSQFLEGVRYQRALEGELARTISTLQSVHSARVHLAIPKQTVFVRNRKMPSASVVVNLLSGRTLAESQAHSIVSLVSASVPELEPERVTVVDQRGRQLTENVEDGAIAFSARQLDYKRNMEEAYIKRIEDILTPMVGMQSVRAQVNAELDFSITERTQEVFNPDQTAVRSEQRVEEADGAGGLAGVPGALSNQPPAGGRLTTDGQAAQETAETAGGAGNLSRRRLVRNYEVDKTVSHTRLATGNVRRLSVAVLIDEKKAEDGTSTAYTDAEIERMTALVRDAIGFNANRGDSVNVITATFAELAEVATIPEEPIWKQPWIKDLGKQVVGVIGVLLLVFGVLRPVMRQLAEAASAPPKRYLVAEGGVAMEEGDENLTDEEKERKQKARKLLSDDIDSNLSTVRQMVNQDPRRVAQVVKNWVGEE